MHRYQGQTRIVPNLPDKQQRQGTMIDGLLAVGGGGHGEQKTKGHIRKQFKDKYDHEDRTKQTAAARPMMVDQGDRFERRRRPENEQMRPTAATVRTTMVETKDRRPSNQPLCIKTLLGVATTMQDSTTSFHQLEETPQTTKWITTEHHKGPMIYTTQPHRKAWLDNRQESHPLANSRIQGRSGLDLFTPVLRLCHHCCKLQASPI